MTDLPATERQLQNVRDAIAAQRAWFGSANDDPALAITMVEDLVAKRGAAALADLVAGYMTLCGQLVVADAARQNISADEVLDVLNTHFASAAPENDGQD